MSRRRDPDVALSVLPFRAWLEAEIARVDSHLPAGDDRCAASLVALRAGVDQRRMRAWLRGNSRVWMSAVDAFACAYDEPGLLRELYPALYDFEDVAA